MEWFKYGMYALLAAMVLVLLLAMRKPDEFRVERSVHIKASPDKAFALINDFHNWGVWSPYEKIDPTMQRAFGGAASGNGAIYEWSGQGKAGAGRMEITASQPAERVAIKLDFIKPFEGHNTAQFTLKPIADETEVTWAMFGPAPFLSKVMQVFFNLDKMIGRDFEVGLANLKAACEK